ncbi:MAG: metallophosphoesterase [Chloroflexi bacterium]|nr:metallophosphoesterase [Chloroflexota bacterium]
MAILTVKNNTCKAPKSLLISFLVLASLAAVQPGAVSAAPTEQTGKIVFGVIGDYGLASQSEADVANLVKGWNPDFIVTVGDNNYPNGAASTIDQNIGQYYHDYIFPYRGSFGSSATYKKFFPVLGNHDWDSNAAQPYFNYFSFYNRIGYYDFIKGPVHFFMLDSDPGEPDGTSSTSEQAKWLKRELAASSSDFNIVVLHHAPYSSGKHGSTSYMQWPFKAWGADAVLAGHDHIYERLSIDGLPYFVNGIGGAEIYPFETQLPGSQVRFNQDYGAMRVEADSTAVKFQFFTRTGLLVDEYQIRKTIPLVTSIARVGPSPANSTSVVYQVKFSEAVIGVDLGDFVLNPPATSGAFIQEVNGSGDTYSVTVNTGNGDGSIRLDLSDNDSITSIIGNKLGGDGIGNGNFSTGDVYSIDKSSPSILSITGLGPNPTNLPGVNFQVIFSEPVMGLDLGDFSIASNSSASLSQINGSGSVYTISANTAAGNDQIRLNFNDNDTVIDSAGNPVGGPGNENGTFTSGETVTVDRSAPIVSSILRKDPNPSNSGIVDFIVTFSEAVTGVDATDFVSSSTNIYGASINHISQSGTSYIVAVNTGTGSGILRLDLTDDDSILDAAGNPAGGTGSGNGVYANGESYNIEKSAPMVTTLTRIHSSPSSLTNVDWLITFSEPVTGVDATDFKISASGITDATIVNVAGSGNQYTISAISGYGDGDLRLDLIDNDSIINVSENPLGGAGWDNGSFKTGEIYVIDKTAPKVTSIIRAGTNPANSSKVDFIVTFSEPVSGAEASDFSLSTAGLSLPSIVSVQNADPFYVVTADTGSGSGTLRLDLIDDDSIRDAAGNNLGGPVAGNGNYVNGESYSVEKTFPSVTSITRSGPNPSSAGSVDFIVTFSEAVTGVDASDFSLSMANIINASIISVTDVDPFYVVRVNTGAGSGSLRLDLIDDDSIANQAGARPGGPGTGNGNFSNGETYEISKAQTNFPAPALKEPRQNFLTGNPSPSFSWTRVREASAYEIVIASDGNFTQNITSFVTSGLTFTGASSFMDGVYYWHVRAYNPAFQPGKFSPTAILTIDTTPPPAPRLISPANFAVTTKTSFVWEKIGSATRYQIEIDSNSDFSSPEWSSLRNSASFQISNMHRGTYYWHVRARDQTGNWGGWSETFGIAFP